MRLRALENTQNAARFRVQKNVSVWRSMFVVEIGFGHAN